MIRILFITFMFTICLANNSNAQSEDDFLALNEVWSKFYQAFDSLDYSLMAEIHDKELIRISGGRRISDYESYINGYKARFATARKENITNNISLRFFERILNDSVASERGIYKLVRNKNKSSEKTYYGQFHVIMKKVNDQWEIWMDYDSSEGGTIGEAQFSDAYPIDEFSPFLKK